MTKNETWKEQFDEMEIWLTDKGYALEVSSDVEDCVYLQDGIVCIRSRNHPETRYYSMLHECGHILVARGLKQWRLDMPTYAQDPKDDTIKGETDGRLAKKKEYKVSLVAEEIEAWKRGRRMAKRMGHHINDIKYNKLMSYCVYTYIEEVATGS